MVLILLSLVLIVSAQDGVEFNEWMAFGPKTIMMPAFADQKDTENHEYNSINLFTSLQLELVNRQDSTWRGVKSGAEGLSLDGGKGQQLYLLEAYLEVGRWTRGSLNLTINGLCEVQVDKRCVFTRKKDSDKEERIELELNQGKHSLLIRVLVADDGLKMKGVFVPDKDFLDCAAETGINPDRSLTINDILDGQQLTSAQISPSGRYLLMAYRDVASETGKQKQFSTIYDLNTSKNLALFRGDEMGGIFWLPRSDRLSYIVKNDEVSDLYLYDFIQGKEQKIIGNLKDFSQYTWSPDEKRIVYSQHMEAEKPGDLKRIYGVEDRLPYFRNRSILNLIDVSSGQVIPLTAGNLSANMHVFSPDSSHILFSTSRMDYAEVPFRKQNLYEMDLATLTMRVIWKDKLYDGDVQYSPDGKNLLVIGGPECFGELGVKVSQGRIPNSYDGQLYVLDLETQKVSAISRDFDPAVGNARWSADGRIYLDVTEKDYGKLYFYNPKAKSYQNLPLQVEVLNRISYDAKGVRAVYSGSGVNSPSKLYILDLKTSKSQLIAYPGSVKFQNVRFGKSESWDFVNKKGDTISGRVYYPVKYQEGEKYPVIVNYYGGTSPVERSFGGRYPIETWAAAGYLVYVLQPSGATGFGQDFSALHVNGWGFDAIDDIIDGTKAFLKAHPMADAQNVGCIGASYGGYTTMLLQTRTELFKTAISHAGISSITSYWGEGYWGYTYNSDAAKNSYPWNRKDIFVENSPIYNADKFQNSILLLHGTDDTNVPVGESLQYYAALKLLGKDVEMVLVDGQNHHIVDYKKRIKWHHTILSWFDKKLKNRPQQWEHLYPEKNY